MNYLAYVKRVRAFTPKSFLRLTTGYEGLSVRSQSDHSIGMYYKTLRTRNVGQIDNFRNKLVSFILTVTSTLDLTNTLAYNEILTEQIRNVFIVQEPDLFHANSLNEITSYPSTENLSIVLGFTQS